MQKSKPVSRIQILREKTRLTQHELAELLGVTEHTVANWENGRNSLEWIDRVIKLCKIFQCPPDQLVEYVPDTEPVGKKTKAEKSHLEEIRKLLDTDKPIPPETNRKFQPKLQE